MGKVLFKLFGFDVSIFRLILGIGGAIVLYLAFDAVRDHFQHIKDLEAENERLETKVTRVEGQRDAVIELNQQNQAAAEVKDEIEDSNQQIAAAERAATRERAQTYREIRDAIQAAPQSADPAQPVAPVVRDTLDRLWNDGPSAGTGGSGGDADSDGLRGTGPGTP